MVAPALMQVVQTVKRSLLPLLFLTWTVCKLGSQVFLVLLCAWLTLFPVWEVLPQISHFRDMLIPECELLCAKNH